MTICSNADNMRVPLLGRKACVLIVKTSRETPANNVKHPIIHAVVNSASAGKQKQRMPRTMNNRPDTMSQIFVLFSITVLFLK